MVRESLLRKPKSRLTAELEYDSSTRLFTVKLAAPSIPTTAGFDIIRELEAVDLNMKLVGYLEAEYTNLIEHKHMAERAGMLSCKTHAGLELDLVAAGMDGEKEYSEFVRFLEQRQEYLKRGRWELMRCLHQLLNRGSLGRVGMDNNPDELPENGEQPILWASRYGYETAVRLLLDRGASAECNDKSGETPLSWAKKNGHERIIQLLSTHETSMNDPSSYRIDNVLPIQDMTNQNEYGSRDVTMEAVEIEGM